MKPTHVLLRAVLISVAFFPLREAAAQEPQITPGMRARVSFYSPYGKKRNVVGRVIEAGRDSIVLAEPRKAFASGQVIRIDVSSGKRRHPVAGFFLGGFGAGAVGAILGAVAMSGKGSYDGWNAGSGAAIGFVSAAMVGAPTGLLIGSFKIYDRWEPARPLR